MSVHILKTSSARTSGKRAEGTKRPGIGGALRLAGRKVKVRVPGGYASRTGWTSSKSESKLDSELGAVYGDESPKAPPGLVSVTILRRIRLPQWSVDGGVSRIVSWDRLRLEVEGSM